MTIQRTGEAKTQSLSALGIGESEESIYRWLLTHPDATVQEISQTLTFSSRKIQQLLNVLESKGLVTHTPERPRRYLPSAPDIALEALILKRQKDLQNVQLVTRNLQEEANAAGRNKEREQVVELIRDRDAQLRIFEHMYSLSRNEIVCLVRLPILVSRLDTPVDQDHSAQWEAQKRGVHCRTVVDAEFLDFPGVVNRVRKDASVGEDIRVISRLPFKLILADRRIAIIPLDLQHSEGPLLLVRSSALLDALYALFEVFWERSAPISFTGQHRMDVHTPYPQLDEEAEHLISLLAAGLNDKTLCHELGISRRTHQRHVSELMQSLNARTRFQAGWLAALRLAAAGAIPGLQAVPDKQSGSE